MIGQTNDYNSLDLEGDSGMDQNKKININSTLKLEQVGNKNNNGEKDSIPSESTSGTGTSTPQKCIVSFIKSYKEFKYKLFFLIRFYSFFSWYFLQLQKIL